MNAICDKSVSYSEAFSTAPNLFSLSTLEHSFVLLRPHQPSLALSVQNLMKECRHLSEAQRHDAWINIDLTAEEVSLLINALSDIAEDAANSDDESQENRIAIHQTLLNWLLYAQTFLAEDPGA